MNTFGELHTAFDSAKESTDHKADEVIGRDKRIDLLEQRVTELETLLIAAGIIPTV